jgi:hypothetical protein
MREADTTIDQRIFETFQSILVPSQQPGNAEITWEVAKTSGSGSLAERVAKKLESEEKIIVRYSGTRVRMDLDRIPLWSDRRDISVANLWKCYSQFPYLPRLASRAVLDHAIADGVSRIGWATESFAYADAHDGSKWVGLVSVQQVHTTPSGLLVHPEPAQEQMAKAEKPVPGGVKGGTTGGESGEGGEPEKGGTITPPKDDKSPTRYFATFDLDPVRGVKQVETILRDLVDHLGKAPGASVKVVVEVDASSTGFSDQTVRVVTENGNNLHAKNNSFED